MAANEAERIEDALKYIDLLFPDPDESRELREHVETIAPELPRSFQNAAVRIISIVESGSNLEIFERAMIIERNQSDDDYLNRDRLIYGGIFQEVSSFRMSQELTTGITGKALDEAANSELRRRLSCKIARKYGSMALGFNPDAQPEDSSSFESITNNPSFIKLQEVVIGRFQQRGA